MDLSAPTAMKRKFIKRRKYRKLSKHYLSSENAVVNLSSIPLTPDELSFFSKGPSFCPTPKPPNPIATRTDTLLFFRRLRLKIFFHGRDTLPHNPFRPTFGWTTRPGLDANLDSFINVTNYMIKTSNPPEPTRVNVNKMERLALKNRQQRDDLVIKPAYKGGAIVFMNKTDYINEALRQLNNPEHYLLLPANRTNQIISEINQFIQNHRSKLPPDIAKYNVIKQARTPLFYLLPEIHKPGNPGRPIVSASGGPTEKLSATVDHFLKPLAQNVDSNLQDTGHFLRKINNLGRIPQSSILVTADVSALHTSIPHHDSILAAKKAQDSRVDKSTPTRILLRFLNFILTCNCFEFNNQHYLQIQGTSIGIICAPNYAILFMDHLETAFLQSQSLSPLVWSRYIDDIFFIWTHGSESLDSF
ncbi:uncharacterized protein LOC110442280 [Mizuhopecten yessoensis]|uniref:uncharacterized protein LOC110442280 n=1 Tax=Mizuhopecten yessoensis TaxID=6573 RepID=UPI000B459891|nr:uncharacterized protein LOC110442280 [Mizuhopecten yessoensis]